MLGSKTQYSLKNAESYFREHLKVGDYYMEGRTVSGEWIGDGAKTLKLSGVTNEKDFINLCRNVNPQTGEQLTPRMNGETNQRGQKRRGSRIRQPSGVL